MKPPDDKREPSEAEILLRVRRSRSGRLEGTLRHPTDSEGKSFSGTLELLSVIEDATAPQRPPSPVHVERQRSHSRS
jgi:hypothetical protein